MDQFSTLGLINYIVVCWELTSKSHQGHWKKRALKNHLSDVNLLTGLTLSGTLSLVDDAPFC